MVVDKTWDHRRTNPKQFGTCSCGWWGVLNELIAYMLKYQKHKYDWLSAKPIEENIEVFHKFSHVQLMSTIVSFHNELVVITMEKPT